ncbi:phosphoribosylamine-glycine ligase, putative, partial [Perkinsus marinus ATCC 50983]
IHPSLIPAFSGEGMYGNLVHQAVVKRGVKVTGCTVHFVTNEYDAGPIILQKVCEISSGDSWEAVRDKVAVAEREAYPAAIQLLVDGCLRVEDGIVEIIEAP